MRQSDRDLGDRRQLAAEVLEHLLEHGHDEGDQGDQDDEGEPPDEAGIALVEVEDCGSSS